MIDRQIGQIPLLGESAEQTFEVTGGTGQIGLGDLHVVEANHWIDREGGDAGTLPDHLTMDLAVGGDVDHDVVDDLGGAPETMTLPQRPLALIVDLGRTGCREAVRSGLDPWPAPDHHLAPATDAPPPAHRVQVDPEGPGSIEDRGPVGEGSSAPGRGEDHLPGHGDSQPLRRRFSRARPLSPGAGGSR